MTTAKSGFELLTAVTKLLDKWFSTKRFRNARSANGIAGKYIRRAKKLYKIEDKTLKKYEKKFYELNKS